MSRTRILAVAIVAMSILALVPAVAEVPAAPAAPEQVAPEQLSASALGTLGQVEFATDLIR
jgi:hypothetical protein